MKKIFKFLSLLFLLILFISITGCTKKQRDNKISYSQLKRIANKEDVEILDYKISGSIANLDENLTVNDIIHCTGTNLALVKNSSDVYSIINFIEGTTICANVSNKSISTSYKYNSAKFMVYYASSPIVIYQTQSGTSYTAHFVDCYGNELMTENNGGTYSLYDFISKNFDDCTYCGIESSIGWSYFRSEYKDSKYTVEKITEDEYKNPSSKNHEETSSGYDDGLTPLYNSKGKVVAYYNGDLEGSFFLYDKKKKYLNNIAISSYGMEHGIPLFLENNLYYFLNDEYYEKAIERSSEETYKCKCLEINLKTGKVKYNDDFKYYVIDADFYVEDDKYRFGYVLYCDLNKNGEKENIIRCAICDDKLSFKDSFVYDGIEIDEVYQLPNKAIVAFYNSGFYYITKNDKVYFNNAYLSSFTKDNELIYVNQNNKYYICKAKDIKESIKDLSNGHYYISSYTYNGESIKIDETNDSKKMTANGHQFLADYLSSAKKGIYIDSNSVTIGEQQIYATSDGISIVNVSFVASAAEKELYSIKLSNNNVIYFYYNFEKTNK